MAQVYVVVAAGSVIAFIIRDVGDASLAGWIIQGPLLMQSVLSPIVGRLSDVLDRTRLMFSRNGHCLETDRGLLSITVNSDASSSSGDLSVQTVSNEARKASRPFR
jgi:hypothetical protein